MELRAGSIVVRPLQEADGIILHRWLNDPTVLEFYEGRDRPQSMEMVRDLFLRKQDMNDVLACMVLFEGHPVGYVQVYYVPHDEQKSLGYDDGLRVCGMDQFLGETALWNRGIGTQLVKLVSQWLIQVCGADWVIMDPRTDNLRAIHVYEKCGFQRVRLLPQHEYHEGAFRDCWLMALAAEEG